MRAPRIVKVGKGFFDGLLPEGETVDLLDTSWDGWGDTVRVTGPARLRVLSRGDAHFLARVEVETLPGGGIEDL